MKIRKATKLNKEDFGKDEQTLIEKLGNHLNIFNEDVFKAFDKKISIVDNLNQEILKFRVTTDGASNLTQSVKKKTSISPLSGISVIRSDIVTGSAITASPYLVWTVSDSLITITKIFGLAPSSTYDITILILGE